MLPRSSLHFCSDPRCINREESQMESSMYPIGIPSKYCSLCTENGLDYIYSSNALIESTGKICTITEHTKCVPMEDALVLQKIKRKGFSKMKLPYFGVFTKKEYSPNEVIGFISGNIGWITQRIETRKKYISNKNACRCFILRDLNLIIDCRSIGNLSRFIRRSCRPNVQVKIELPEEEWKTLPPTKKCFPGVPKIKAKLSAMRRILSDTELLIDGSFCAHNNERVFSINLTIQPNEYTSICACASDTFCLFSKPYTPYTNRSLIPSTYSNTLPNTSLLMDRLHKHISTLTNNTHLLIHSKNKYSIQSQVFLSST
ncbi:hypothetical protein NEOKW01_0293 [Nematocida sp. AWRm80]|nr:hypothetical protein NEOKW01_0293 [Nematocida sp. AWRm80]